MAVTREGIPVRVWTFPGNTSDQVLIPHRERRPARLELEPALDRGFTSAENRRYLQRAGGHYITGEKLRGDSTEAAADGSHPSELGPPFTASWSGSAPRRFFARTLAPPRRACERTPCCTAGLVHGSLPAGPDRTVGGLGVPMQQHCTSAGDRRVDAHRPLREGREPDPLPDR